MSRCWNARDAGSSRSVGDFGALALRIFLMKVHEEGEWVSNMMRMRWTTTKDIALTIRRGTRRKHASARFELGERGRAKEQGIERNEGGRSGWQEKEREPDEG